MSSKENGSEIDHRMIPVQPVILDGLVQSSFLFARVFTLFFLQGYLVLTKTGSFGTNTYGSIRGSLGGFTPEAMVTGAIGTLADQLNEEGRRTRAFELAALSPDQMVAAHKRNFKISYEDVESVEIRGPNFAGELSIIVLAGGRYKFRMDRQSRVSAKNVKDLFLRYLQGKIKGL